MIYSDIEQWAFYRRQARRLLELVEGCKDAREIAVLLQAVTYNMEQFVGRPILVPGKRRPSDPLN